MTHITNSGSRTITLPRRLIQMYMDLTCYTSTAAQFSDFMYFEQALRNMVHAL